MCLPFRRRRGIGAALLAAALCGWAVPSADAGQHKAKWWRSETYQRELGLSADQVQRIEHVFQESWPALQESKQELDRLERELSQTIADGTAEESRILRLIDGVETSRSALGRTRSLMLFRMYRVLSPTQRSKLRSLHDAQNRERPSTGDSAR